MAENEMLRAALRQAAEKARESGLTALDGKSQILDMGVYLNSALAAANKAIRKYLVTKKQIDDAIQQAESTLGLTHNVGSQTAIAWLHQASFDIEQEIVKLKMIIDEIQAILKGKVIGMDINIDQIINQVNGAAGNFEGHANLI